MGTPSKAAFDAHFGPPADGRTASAEAADALSDLYRRHWSELCRYIARTFGGGPPEPEDVAQAAFAQFAALADPRQVENPRAFLYRTARNLVFDQHRREAVRGRHAREAMAGCDGDRTDDRDAERVLSSKQRLTIIEAAIRAMEPRRRTVFVMNRIQELSFAEISRQTGMPEATVKRHVAKAVVECELALRAAEGPLAEGELR